MNTSTKTFLLTVAGGLAVAFLWERMRPAVTAADQGLIAEYQWRPDWWNATV